MQIRSTDDPGEFALRIAQRFEGRITAMELTVSEMQAEISRVIRIEGKRSAKRLTVIGTVAVALIGGITQWQVTRMNTQAQLQTAEMARQKLDDSDQRIEKVIEETAKKVSKATLAERDRQVDTLVAKGP